MMILIGCAGYSYADWKGVFYPPKIPAGEMLSYYARHFPFTELNTTFYRMPTASQLASMEAKTPPGFLFFVKAFSTITHQREATEEDFALFRYALRPLEEAGKLAGVLAQFPTSFRLRDENRAYLRYLRDQWPDLTIAVEFRHREWIEDEGTFELLEDENLAYVCVDEPGFKGLVPPVIRATADTGYVRFHGRNYQKWWQHAKPEERYDYLYSEDELSEWVPRLLSLDGRTEKTYVSMNNHRRGQAALNGRMLRELLEIAQEKGQLPPTADQDIGKEPLEPGEPAEP